MPHCALCGERYGSLPGTCRWIDEGTRAVAVTFNLYNTNTNSLTVARFLVRRGITRVCIAAVLTSVAACGGAGGVLLHGLHRAILGGVFHAYHPVPSQARHFPWLPGGTVGHHASLLGGCPLNSAVPPSTLTRNTTPQMAKEFRHMRHIHPHVKHFLKFRSWFEIVFLAINTACAAYWLRFALSPSRAAFDTSSTHYVDYFEVEGALCVPHLLTR